MKPNNFEDDNTLAVQEIPLIPLFVVQKKSDGTIDFSIEDIKKNLTDSRYELNRLEVISKVSEYVRNKNKIADYNSLENQLKGEEMFLKDMNGTLQTINYSSINNFDEWYTRFEALLNNFLRLINLSESNQFDIDDFSRGFFIDEITPGPSPVSSTESEPCPSPGPSPCPSSSGVLFNNLVGNYEFLLDYLNTKEIINDNSRGRLPITRKL